MAVLDLQGEEAEADVRITCDLSIESEVVGGVARAKERLGGLDIAILCAGVGGRSQIVEMPASEWDRVMDVNLRGTFLCLRECARHMSGGGGSGAGGRRGGRPDREARGSIVAVTSVCGFLADRGTSHYNVSKAGADMLVRVAARELGPLGIRVNAVAPGTTDTPMFSPTYRIPGYKEAVAQRAALGRLGEPSDIADAAVALVELEWVTGQTLVADGGLSLFSPVDVTEHL